MFPAADAYGSTRAATIRRALRGNRPVSKNAIFFLIDALRYDTVADLAAARDLIPNIAALAERGIVRRAVANAQSTQMVMPAIYSLTYPLDYDGYNTGIRNRPKSFVEVLREAGYDTHLAASCNQLGVTHGYDRGFAHRHTSVDCRHILEYLINKVLSYELDLWRSGERSEADTIAVLQRELSLLLDAVAELAAGREARIWSPRLRRINGRLAAGCPAEKDLLMRSPQAVLRKLTRIPAGLYWRYLGRTDTRGLLLARAAESVRWRTRTWIAPTRFPFLLMSYYETKADAVIAGVRAIVRQAPRPWYVHLHVMDVHDCRSLSRPLFVLKSLRFLPRWLRARSAGKTSRHFTYDLALMAVDHEFGKLVDELKRNGQVDDTVILITGDHGSSWAESPRAKQPIAGRTHYEDIEVPIVVFGDGRRPSDQGMIDSMGISATLLDTLGLPPHASFKGRSMFGPGRKAVITETAGAGNADLERRDLHFTVTGPTHKLMAVLKGNRLSARALYDLVADPKELRNVAEDPANSPIVDSLMRHLREERFELFKMRGLDMQREAVS
ncbi:MAG: hypothetical protein FJX62_03115 [Alphaproteobacteria bacterium]|nr:hypothetical protein [Alphaproteobacteria bacterium]